MMNISSFSKKQITWSVLAILAGAAALYLILRPAPIDVFRKDAEKTTETLNEYKHIELEKKLSPQMVAWIENESLSATQALSMVRNADFVEKRKYRLVQVLVFHPYDYAEAQFQRSAPEGRFEGGSHFKVPFIYLGGKWKITPYNKYGVEAIEYPE